MHNLFDLFQYPSEQEQAESKQVKSEPPEDELVVRQPSVLPQATPTRVIKYSFTSTITAENMLRLAQYRANKPGGARVTDVFNQALEQYLNAHSLFADTEPEEFDDDSAYE